MENVILKIKDFFNHFIYEQINLVMEYGDKVLLAFKYIAFIMVLVKIVTNLYNSPRDWKGYVSWLPVAILMLNYDILILAFIDLSQSVDNTVSIGNHQELYGKLFFGDGSSEILSDTPWSSMPYTLVTMGFQNMLFHIGVKYLLMLSVLLSVAAYIYIKVKVLFNLISLAFFGPLNISLSFIPGMENHYMGWLLKLLETSFFLPFLYFIDYIGIEILKRAFKPMIINNGVDMVEGITKSWLGVMFFLMMTVAYFFIPKMVKYGISQGTAASGTGKKAGAALLLAARKITAGI